MILSRVIEHVKAQNWTAVILDFVIVVVGVFIGIQVSNWNEARVDRARAQAFLERIATDLDTDIATYRDRLQFWGEVYDYGAKAAAYAESGDADGLSQWRLLVAYFQASQVAEFYPANSTYEELKSAGELGLIANTKLRDSLAKYYRSAANPIITERPAYRMHVRGLIPLSVQSHIWNHCYAADSEIQRLLDCDSPISEADARSIVEAISQDKSLMNELRYWASTMEVASMFGTHSVALAVSLRQIVKVELGETESAP
ncbi:hypothetical protein E4T66_02105 [Sinimarinibacterium sp. CAU 1509]|uniref:DUF6090 family protein n=1 Tax=Sinimarinibacterium sp. CAU 1509 TaxID=2562283 RepID=UPI0010AC77B9|nr:DUF6090 family protein [Sinimarinibacterium sp. CAU 1509]TJY65037.1 hypothetical protein E4T66_02105 [Sinimarinibacterium sp. CAU 1509]